MLQLHCMSLQPVLRLQRYPRIIRLRISFCLYLACSFSSNLARAAEPAARALACSSTPTSKPTPSAPCPCNKGHAVKHTVRKSMLGPQHVAALTHSMGKQQACSQGSLRHPFCSSLRCSHKAALAGAVQLPCSSPAPPPPSPYASAAAALAGPGFPEQNQLTQPTQQAAHTVNQCAACSDVNKPCTCKQC